MNIFLDAHHGRGGDPFTVELENATTHNVMVAAQKILNRSEGELSHFEVWPRDGDADEPAHVYTVADIDNYFTSGIQDCKSIW